VSDWIKENGAMGKSQAVLLWLVQDGWTGIMNHHHSFGFRVRMAAALGIQPTGKLKTAVCQEMQSLQTVSCARNI
jgi:hypothetical protein